MKKIIFVLFILVALFGALYYLLEEETSVTERRIAYAREGEEIRVLEGDREIFVYTIEDFRSWAEENWEELFEEPPMFSPEIEGSEVNPGSFYFFDRTASMSPNNKTFSFSVHSYYAASSLSFVGLVNLETGETEMIKGKSRGNIQSILWSPNGEYVAYILDTARAEGDRMSLDNVLNLEKKLTLSGGDILLALEQTENVQETDFFPFFENLQWRDDNRRVSFWTDDVERNQVEWIIDTKGEDLRRIQDFEEIDVTGNLLINNPGMEEDVWYLSYEEPGEPGLLTKINLINNSICFGGEDFCQKLVEKDDDLSGKRVEVYAIKNNDIFEILEIGILD